MFIDECQLLNHNDNGYHLFSSGLDILIFTLAHLSEWFQNTIRMQLTMLLTMFRFVVLKCCDCLAYLKIAQKPLRIVVNKQTTNKNREKTRDIGIVEMYFIFDYNHYDFIM